MPSLERLLQQYSPSPLFPEPLTAENCMRVDLSASNPDLERYQVQNQASLQEYLDILLGRAQKRYALGGYKEQRSIYRRFHHFGDSDLPSPREYHLGVDIWTRQGTPVYAPLPGHIHSRAHNSAPGDYGGTLILEHQLENATIYSLFGHLDPARALTWEAGAPVAAGEFLAALGGPEENVGWPPHLHFQLIKEMKGYRGDFPGVCSKEDLLHYLELCPNPEYLLKLEI